MEDIQYFLPIGRLFARSCHSLIDLIGITQELLATKLQLRGCDLTRSAVAKIEVGQRHLYIDEVILIKEILDVSYEELLS